NDARSRPINVGTVLEDDVNKRLAEHRFAADEFHFWRGNEDTGNRISDLVLDQIRRAAFPLSVNDHLHVAQIGNRIERGVDQTVDSSCDSEDCENENEEFVPRATFDNAVN